MIDIAHFYWHNTFILTIFRKWAHRQKILMIFFSIVLSEQLSLHRKLCFRGNKGSVHDFLLLGGIEFFICFFKIVSTFISFGWMHLCFIAECMLIEKFLFWGIFRIIFKLIMWHWFIFVLMIARRSHRALLNENRLYSFFEVLGWFGKLIIYCLEAICHFIGLISKIK